VAVVYIRRAVKLYCHVFTAINLRERPHNFKTFNCGLLYID